MPFLRGGLIYLSATQLFTPDSLVSGLQRLEVSTGYCVALSGGADSVALLVAMAELRQRLQKPLRAVHVHHGLQAQGDEWAAFCKDLCGQLEVPLSVIALDIRRQRRESLEMAARRQRYAALAEVLLPDEVLLTAHHLDDQAETFLLHLFRGAGVNGLAAMPVARTFSRGLLCRPLLGWRRERLVAFLRGRGIDWVEDPSNDDVSFDRNFIRQNIMPMIASRWPAVATAIGRSARLQADQRTLNAAVARDALDSGYAFNTGAVRVDKILAMDLPRRHLLLRYWLEIGRPRLMLSLARLEALERRLSSSNHFDYKVAGVQLQVFAGHLYKRMPSVTEPAVACRWQLDRRLQIEALGVVLEPSQILRYFPQLVPGDTLDVTSRQGGETIYIPDVGHRPLKKLLQQWRVPKWRRSCLPLILYGEQVICVPGYWLACELNQGRDSHPIR